MRSSPWLKKNTVVVAFIQGTFVCLLPFVDVQCDKQCEVECNMRSMETLNNQEEMY